MKINSFQTYTPEEETIEITENSNESGGSDKIITTNVNKTTTSNVSSAVNVSTNTNQSKKSDNTSISLNINATDDTNANISFDVSASNESSDDENVTISMNVDGVSTSNETTTSYSENSNQSSSSNVSNTNSTKPKRCSYPTSSLDFSKIKTNITSKDFEDSKLSIAKDIAKAKCLKSVQIRDIMKLFSHEDSRLDFAKFAYKYVYDKENYYEVYNAFEHELTIDELKEAIK